MSSSCFAEWVQKKPMSDEALQLVARRFAVLAEPMRLRLLQALMQGELSVGALAQVSGGTQANTSRHLQTLAEAGMVARRKEGLMVFYKVSDPSVFELCTLVCGSVGEQLKAKASAFSS
jgi:DNA-binding transcriptional ArsR family regulator